MTYQMEVKIPLSQNLADNSVSKLGQQKYLETTQRRRIVVGS